MDAFLWSVFGLALAGYALLVLMIVLILSHDQDHWDDGR